MGLNLRPEPYLVSGGTAVPPPTQVPTNTVLPTIVGPATVGQSITGDNGSWDQPPILSYAYQHQESATGVGAGTDIPGANAANYSLTSGQAGKYFRRGVKASNAIGAAAAFAYSAYIGPIVAAPAITGTPDTTGTVGAAYSFTPAKSGGRGAGLWTLVGTIGASGLVFDNSTGALTATTLGAAATYGPYSVYWTDGDGIQSNTIGPWSVVVSAGGGGTAPTIQTAPVISGTPDIGQNITAANGTYGGSPAPTITGEWQLDGVGLGDTDLSFAITMAQSKPTGGVLRWYETATNLSGSVSQPSNTLQVYYPTHLNPTPWFDAEVYSSLTEVGGPVSAWASIGADAAAMTQVTAAFRPTYSPTGLNGRPAVTGDGTDDTLRNTALTGLWPATSVASVIRGVVSQPTGAGTTGIRYIFGYGNSGGSTVRARLLYRTVVSAVNRFVADVGTGGGNIPSTNATVDFSGVHSVTGNFGSAAVQADVDGNAGPSVAAVPSTISLQGALFARPTDTATGYSAISINCLGSFPATLTAAQLLSQDRWEAARKVP